MHPLPLLFATALLALPGSAAPALCPAVRPPDLRGFTLVPTGRAEGATGEVELRFADSPFGVSLSRDGTHLYRITITTAGLPREGGVPVAWVATPSLDRVRRLGTPDAEGTLRAEVALNKFLLFVTLEPSADVERRSGPILLRGIAPSGRMHTMMGHGPFAGEPCGTEPFGPR